MWQNFLGDIIDRIYGVKTFISKYLYFKKGWGSHFCWQILTMFVITIYKDSRKVKISRNYVSKYNLYLYFLIEQNLLYQEIVLMSGEKMLMSAELQRCVTWFIYFLDFHWVRYNCAIFVGYMWQILGRGAFLPPPPRHPWAAPKKPILNRVKASASKCFCFCVLLLRKL